MGGGLGFLNKKSWHTGGMRQQEEVWKKEQEYAAEQKKLKELQKQIQEERKAEELREVAAEAGHVEKVERLDWMYAGLLSSKQAADDAMNKTAQLDAKEEEKSRCEATATLPSFYTDDTPKSALEQWQRLNNDPLFAIKRQEAAARSRIKTNPVRMAQIQNELSVLKSAASGGKHKKEKRDKKEKKEKKERRERDRPHEDRGHKRDRSRSRSRDRSPEQQQHHRRQHLVDDASVQRHGGSYGLDAGHVPENVRSARESAGGATRRMLEEAARKREEEARAAAERPRHQRHQPARLSADDKAKRLREMMSDAATHETQRHLKVSKYSKEEEEEESRTRNSDHASFASKMNRDVYGAQGSGDGIADRIGRRAHFREHGGGGSSFRR
mmetsp:Transcript_35609/g.100801  ORF Transcript_35609/g.100801 Transcript_35609/m.100801 type:complete len:384 (+) Transcript_35609:175-1326(+)